MANADAIKEMMDNWNKTEEAVKATFPKASAEAIYQMTAEAMKRSLGL